MSNTRRGRPPLDPSDRSITFAITLPRRQYDRYCVDALRSHVSVPEIIRRELGNKHLKNAGGKVIP